MYSQEELLRLIDLHCTDPAAQRESGLTRADHRLLMGALSFKHKLVHPACIVAIIVLPFVLLDLLILIQTCCTDMRDYFALRLKRSVCIRGWDWA